LVTVKVYVVAAERLVTVVVDLSPVLVTLPALPVPVTVHVPDDGNPLSATDPVATEQVGWVIVPMIGADGSVSELIATFADAGEVHPVALVTVKV
jgi:hypothetical protein